LSVGTDLYVATDNGVFVNSTFLNTTAVREQSSSLFSVYPNPVSKNNKQLIVSTGNQSGNIHFDIFNSLGQIVFTESGFISNRESYVIDNLQPEIYFLKANFQVKSSAKKVVVK